MAKRKPSDLRVKLHDKGVLRGVADQPIRGGIKGKTIHIARTTPSRMNYVKAHETAHYVLGHGDRETRNPANLIRQELQADIYARKETGHTRRYKKGLTQIYKYVQGEKYKLSPQKAKAIIDKQINQSNIPTQWKNDWASVKREVK
jgi:aromatic ring hydroxylase